MPETREQLAYRVGARYLEVLASRGPRGNYSGINVRQVISSEFGVNRRFIDRAAQFARALNSMTADQRDLVLEGLSGLTMEEVRSGAIPHMNGNLDMLRSRRRLRAQQEAMDRLYAADVAKEESMATDGQPTLQAVCEAIRLIAERVAAVTSLGADLADRAHEEQWTQHTRHRVRANLQALRSDLQFLDNLLR